MTRTRVLLLAAVFVAGQGVAGADDSGGMAPKPLYVHWYKAEYRSGDGSAAVHLATLRVHPGSTIDLAFPDPTLPGRTCRLRGDVRRAEDGFDLNFTASWRSGSRFQGRFVLDVPREGRVGWFAGAYWPTALVVTHESSATPFLGQTVTDEPLRNTPGENE